MAAAGNAFSGLRRAVCVSWAVVLIGLSFALPAQAESRSYAVTGTADAVGSCRGRVCTSLRAAMRAAQLTPGSTVRLGAGNFKLGAGPGRPVGTGELQAYAELTITGAGARRTVIEQTDGQDRVLDIYRAVRGVTLDNLTIRGGALSGGASEPGAAIFTLAPLMLRGVDVVGNRELASSALPVGDCCQSVGAIVSLGALTLWHSEVSDNVAAGSSGAPGSGSDGGQAVGAILATKGQPITLIDSAVSRNIARGGAGGSSSRATGGAGADAYGGMFVIDNAPLTVTGSTFAANQARAGAGGHGASGGPGGSSYGGAVFIPDGKLEVSSSTLAGNLVQAGAGGSGSGGPGGAGGEAEGGGLAGGSRSEANWVLNSTFNGNRALGGAAGAGSLAGMNGISVGGGIAEDLDASLAIVSSTFDANVAGGAGPSYGGNLYDQPSPIVIAQSIFAHGSARTGANCAILAPESDRGHNLEASSPSQCGFLTARKDLIGRSPRLRRLARNGGPSETMALGVGSPAIAGAPRCLDYTQPSAPPLRVDERGRSRRGSCDIGAFQARATRRRAA
ncbi:MAG: choice-of-anchor Q domain-containing protein [Solirubrobacteraceae bacterium]